VEFATATTIPTSDGGECDANCNDHLEAILTVGTDWLEFTVDFAALAQEGWGPKPEDLAHTIFVYFGILGTDGGPVRGGLERNPNGQSEAYCVTPAALHGSRLESSQPRGSR
jgi:hypothetical protein